MVRPLSNPRLASGPAEGWLDAFRRDFQRRVMELLSFQFASLPTSLGLSLVGHTKGGLKDQAAQASLTTAQLHQHLLPHDLKRMEAYSRNMVDYHLIVDLLPALARLYFGGKLGPNVKLSQVQAAVLLAQGLQHKTVGTLEKEMGLPSAQLLAMFNKSMRKLYKHLQASVEGEVEAEAAPRLRSALEREASERESMTPLESMAKELKEGGKNMEKKLNEKQQKLLESLDLNKYAVTGTDERWGKALPKDGSTPSTVVSVGNVRAVKSAGDAEAEASAVFCGATDKGKKKGGKKRMRALAGKGKKQKARSKGSKKTKKKR